MTDPAEKLASDYAMAFPAGFRVERINAFLAGFAAASAPPLSPPLSELSESGDDTGGDSCHGHPGAPRRQSSHPTE